MATPNQQIESTSDDRLWAMLCYIFTPIVPIITMLMDNKKNRPFIKAHYMQALILGLVMSVVYAIFGSITLGLGFCFGFLIWIYPIYLGIKAYRGETFDIPVISNFVRQQGW